MRRLILLVVVLGAIPLIGAEPTSIYIVDDAAMRAAQELAGSGIMLPGGGVTREARDAHGRSIVWREVRRSHDERGGTHVFYRQFLIDGRVEALLDGSHAALHFDPDGRLAAVIGAQYRTVMVVNRPEIDVVIAASRARNGVAVFARASDGEMGERDSSDARGSLHIVPGSDGELRYAWRIPVANADGPRTAFVDAQSEQLMGISVAERSTNCYPDTTSHVSATGIPVRATGTRAIGATPATTRPGYSHEAFWSIGPYLAVHQEVSAGTSWQCIPSGSYNSYSLVAIGNVSGVPTYDDTNPFKGRAAGDAMYQTRQTMLAFSTMGWTSWDGAGSNATAIVESTYAVQDQARFVTPDHASQNNLPPGAAVAIGRPANYWNMAAALDVVAHEWGHGVTYTTAQFPVDDLDATTRQNAQQMDEGFADVIANIVERLRQPAGANNVIEKSGDWTIHEDAAGFDASGNLGYARGAADDGTAGHRYVYKNGTLPAAVKDQLHRYDPDVTNATAPHTSGNMLVVVLRLLTEGGKNPLCSRTSPPAFCSSLPTVSALGFTNARKTMWNAIINWVPPNATWESTDPARVVGNAVMQSAYATFKACGASPVYVPIAEQQAVYNAFANIGYPPTQSVITTCQ